jgi:hypothetical protein
MRASFFAAIAGAPAAIAGFIGTACAAPVSSRLSPVSSLGRCERAACRLNFAPTTTHKRLPDPLTKGAHAMTTYNPTKVTTKIAFAIATVVIGFGVLQLVAGSMTHPNPDTMAVRQQVIAMEAERAAQFRDLARGEVRVAATRKAQSF